MTRGFKDADHDQNKSIPLETRPAALLGALDYKEVPQCLQVLFLFLFFSYPRNEKLLIRSGRADGAWLEFMDLHNKATWNNEHS